MVKSVYANWLKKLKSDRAAVFLEYAMLLALVVIVACTPLMPGGLVYEYLQKELTLRLTIICLPIF